MKPTALTELAQRFLAWLNDARLEGKTKTYYRNDWRMLKPTAVADMQVDEITGDWTDRLKFAARLETLIARYEHCDECFTKPRSGV